MSKTSFENTGKEDDFVNYSGDGRTADPNKYYVVKPPTDSPAIINSMYDTLKYYREELLKAEGQLSGLTKKANNANTAFKRENTGIKALIERDIKIAEKAVRDEKEEEESSDEDDDTTDEENDDDDSEDDDEDDIKNVDENDEKDINEPEEGVEEEVEEVEDVPEREKTENEKKLETLKKQLQQEKRLINDKYREVDQCKTRIDGYLDLFGTLNEIYKNARLSQPIKKEYEERDNIKDKIDDIIDVYESKYKDLTEVDAVNSRITYQRLMVSKDSSKKLGETDVIKNEDGYRNEYLFKKLYLKSQIPNPKIDITKKKFYASYDFATKHNLYEMKTVIQHENQEELRFFISVDKVKKLIEASKASGKKPNIYWYVEGKKGYLSGMSMSQLDKINKSVYQQNLYTLADPLTEKTFTVKDIYNEGGNLNQVTYMLRATDRRIAYLGD